MLRPPTYTYINASLNGLPSKNVFDYFGYNINCIRECKWSSLYVNYFYVTVRLSCLFVYICYRLWG